MQSIDKKILKIVNDYLESSNKDAVGYDDSLFSSGLLDSIEFFELLVVLESNDVKLKPLKTNSDMKLPIERYDTVSRMIEGVE